MDPNEITTEESPAETLRQNVQIAQYEQSEQDRLQNNKLRKLSSFKKNRGGPALHVPWIGLWVMLLLAILVDVISFLINLLPVVGGILEAVVLTPISILMFWLYGLLSGISLFRGTRKFITSFVCIAGFLPVLNAIPEWTFEVIALIVITFTEVNAGKLLNKLPKSIKRVLPK